MAYNSEPKITVYSQEPNSIKIRVRIPYVNGLVKMSQQLKVVAVNPTT